MAEAMTKSPEMKPEAAKGPQKSGEKKWLLWGLIGFTAILLVTAVVLFFQLRKPVEQPLPSPAASPTTPPVQQAEPEGVCEVAFLLTETLVCYSECDAANDLCPVGTSCENVSGAYLCVNVDCPEESDCECPAEDLVCYDECDPADDLCPTNTNCEEVDGEYLCVDPDCPEESDCDCDDEELVCFDECTTNSECPDDLSCMTVDGDDRCVNPSCQDETDCECPGASPSPSPSATPTPTPSASASVYASPSPSSTLIAQASPRAGQPELPEAGVSTPAVLGISAGILLMLLGLLF